MQPANPIRRKLPQSSTRRLAVLLGCLTFASMEEPARAQTLPPTSPTAPQVAAAQTPPPPAQPSAHRARVDFAAGKLVVTAENSSLNQILRDIARLTGMTITGGVADERVFGTYGPADASTILSALLNGTGSNMLFIQDGSQAPQQLVLTPRQGGPTPPNPNALRDALEDADLPPQLAPRIPRQPFPPYAQQPNGPLSAQPAGSSPNNPTGFPQPGAEGQSPTQLLGQPAAIPGLVAPPADATTQQSPNGIKTPQQIYDQLMKLQQQQAKPPQ